MNTGIQLKPGDLMSTSKNTAALLCLLLFALSTVANATKIPEGTDVRLQVNEKISSATATEGQRFDLTLDEDLRVGGVVVVARGAKAVGTVISARKRGHMGKAGELNIQINYLLVRDQRLPLRASSGLEGDSKVGATVALTVLFGPLGLLKRGKDVELNPGVVLTAQVDQTMDLSPSPLVTAVVQSSAPASFGKPPENAAYDNPSGSAARAELIKLGCSTGFSLISSSAGRSIFESTCDSGKRQLLECVGGGCRPLN